MIRIERRWEDLDRWIFNIQEEEEHRYEIHEQGIAIILGLADTLELIAELK